MRVLTMVARDARSAAPVSADDFAAMMAPLYRGGPLALAVSGGGDSMALMSLAAEWARPAGVELLIMTVDHGLRDGSAEDAAFVEAQAGALGLQVKRLTWVGEKPTSGLQASARKARYGLMAAACREAGIDSLALAHTMNDQAETVLMRLARGAGVDGLTAMAPETELYGLRLVRPLLGVSREDLRMTLQIRGLVWRNDPGNDDQSFERIRARQVLAALAPIGVDVTALSETAERMAEARAALDAAAAALAVKAAVFEPLGYVSLDVGMVAAAPRETAQRLVSAAIRWVSGAPYAPGREELMRALDWTASRPGSGGRTLHGCQFEARGGAVMIAREFAAASDAVDVAAGLWDGRFDCEVRNAGEGQGLTIAPLGPDGAKQIKADGGAPEDWVRAPRAAKLSSPALWRDNELISAPFAGWENRSGGPALRAVSAPAPFSLKGTVERLC